MCANHYLSSLLRRQALEARVCVIAQRTRLRTFVLEWVQLKVHLTAYRNHQLVEARATSAWLFSNPQNAQVLMQEYCNDKKYENVRLAARVAASDHIHS